jgi:DNA-binding PadR family transcriptional regulator
MRISNFYILRPSIALEIGEAEAALLEKIAVYCRGSAKSLKGECGKWIYNSISSWKTQHFQHWSESKLYRALKSLEEQGLIKSKKANFRGRQNIRWYTATEAGYKLLNDNIAKTLRSNYQNNEEIYSNELYITKEELEKDIEYVNQKQEEFNSLTLVGTNVEKKPNTSSFFQSEKDSGQIDELYYIAENTTERASSKGVEEEKYFELGKKKKEEEGSVQKEEVRYEKEKLKKIQDIDKLIEEEVERRVREIIQGRLEKEVAEEMERLYREYEKAHEDDGTEIQQGFNFSKIFLNLEKRALATEEKKELEEENRADLTGVKNTVMVTKATETLDITKEEASTVQIMVKLWNQVFEHSVSPIKAYASKSNQEALLTLYKTIFNSDLNNWREYALKVNSSQFLMGEKKTKNNFKAVFGWLIKPETVEKILSGEYGVGDRELDMNNKVRNAEIKKEQKVSELENRVASNLKENLNEFKEYEEFRSYIENEGYEEDNDKYKLGVVLRRIPKRNFLHSEEYKLMRDRMFESYLMKKHTDQSRLEIRNKLRSAVNNTSEETRFIVTQEMPRQAGRIEENTKTLELHGKSTNVNYQNKLTTITTIKDWEQSYGK